MDAETKPCAHCGAPLTAEWKCLHCGQAAPAPWLVPVGATPTASSTMPLPLAPAPAFAVGTSGICRQCGGAPAVEVIFKQGVGMLFVRRVFTTGGWLCRDCGRAVGRQALNRTLLTGWWGMFSFFANFVYVAHAAAALRELHALAEPQPPSTRRLAPGRPVLQRIGALLALSVLVVAAAFGANVLKGPDHEGDAVTWVVGACVNVEGRRARAVLCTDSHDAKVTRVVNVATQCGRASGTVTVEGHVYCVESETSGAN